MDSTTEPPSTVSADFLLIGGGIAAVTAAQTLRDEGAEGSILILCAEAESPYNRPPLTKGIITGDLNPEHLLLATSERYRDDKIDVRLNSTVCSLDPATRSVVDRFSATYRYGKLLIATGALPCKLAVPGAELDGVFTFRSLSDALALRRWVSANPGPVGIVGTSFIAMELATSVTRAGIKVALIDQAGAVFPKIYSPTLSSYFLDRCKRFGIDVLLSETVREIRGVGKVSTLETASGKSVACATVIIAIGATPHTGFLEILRRHGGLRSAFLQA